MRPLVEPQTGHDLERLITALLNVTGAVHRVIDTIGHRPAADGVEVIGTVADCLHYILAPLAEHNSDGQLAVVTHMLAEATLLVAAELDSDGLLAGR
jgi:hypothetical protein